MWQVTCDMWNLTHRWLWTLSQNVRSPALTVWKLWCFEDWEEKNQWLTEWIKNNDKGVCVCRTASLLNTWIFFLIRRYEVKKQEITDLFQQTIFLAKMWTLKRGWSQHRQGYIECVEPHVGENKLALHYKVFILVNISFPWKVYVWKKFDKLIKS